MQKAFGKIFLAVAILTFPIVTFSKSDQAIEKTQKIIGEIIEKSYPELKAEKIEIKTFQSYSNYFKSQFSVSRYLTFQKLNYIIFVNPDVFSRKAPDEGIRAILAHEVSHILYYKRKNWLELLGLVGLTDKSFTTKFERRADLEAIARGYGEGLKSYRKWLYEHIPSKNVEAKKHDYFSPEEIDLMLKILREKPQMINFWHKKVPRNLTEILKPN